VLSGISPQSNAEVDTDSLPSDGGNWEEFVSISKTEEISAQEPRASISSSEDSGPGFNWDNISLDQDPVETPAERPVAMFEDEVEDDIGHPSDSSETDSINLDKDEISQEPSPPAIEPEPTITSRSEPDTLTLDVDTHSPLESQHIPKVDNFEQEQIYPREGTNPYQTKKTSRFFTKLLYTLITLIVLLVIVAASFAILANIGVIPKDTSDKAVALVESLTPIKFTNKSKMGVIITEHKGVWIDTVNGPIYVISGLILNKSNAPVNHVQIKSQFVSAGETLYEDIVYAGNTFTKDELKNSQLEDILLKLKKKRGDTEFFDTKKIAGLNYDIRPKESIPFFTVFPSKSKVLGLKYNLQVIDYEDESVE